MWFYTVCCYFFLFHFFLIFISLFLYFFISLFISLFIYLFIYLFLSDKTCDIVNIRPLLMSIHWSVCWLKKTENKWLIWFYCHFFFFFLIILWLFTIKMIIDFKNFLLAFPWRPHGPGRKQITNSGSQRCGKVYFPLFLVMSTVQNETLTN